ncbi:TPA: toll-Interleukin receptor, partial [Streptococcus suis]
AHHCKDKRLIEMLNSLLENTFNDFSESTLSVLELGDFDKQVKELSNNINYKIGNHHEERKIELERQDIIEGEMYSETTEEDREEIIRQNKVRAAIQTVEVIGVILKNRYGSIKNKDFEKILKNTVDSNLRLLNSFIEIVSDKNFINFLENFISQNIIEEEFDRSRLQDEIRDLLIRMNFATIFTLIMKTISSIGSETISRYFSDMLKNYILTPSYILIKRGLELQYEKRFSEDDILSDLKNKEVSHVARTMLNLMVVNHVSRHHFKFQEKARIEKKFGFKPNVILKREQQIKSIEN